MRGGQAPPLDSKRCAGSNGAIRQGARPVPLKTPSQLTEEAQRLWNEFSRSLEHAITRAIRRMWDGEVGNTLVRDGAMRDAIKQDVRVAIWKADTNGKLPEGPEHARRWFYCVVKRATRRRTIRQARHLVNCTESATEDPAIDQIPDHLTPEIIVGARMLVQRLLDLVGQLSVTDQRIFSARLRNEYATLAAELGMDQGALRTRACRICKWLRKQLMADDDSR